MYFALLKQKQIIKELEFREKDTIQFRLNQNKNTHTHKKKKKKNLQLLYIISYNLNNYVIDTPICKLKN